MTDNSIKKTNSEKEERISPGSEDDVLSNILFTLKSKSFLYNTSDICKHFKFKTKSLRNFKNQVMIGTYRYLLKLKSTIRPSILASQQLEKDHVHGKPN